MSFSVLVGCLLLVMALAYHFGRKRALLCVGGLMGMRKLHSLPVYYGTYLLLWTALPALLVLLFWTILEVPILKLLIEQYLPAELVPSSKQHYSLLISQIQQMATEQSSFFDDANPALLSVATEYSRLLHVSAIAKASLVLSLAVFFALFAWRKINPKMRARSKVESVFKWALIICSLIAILTTLGIVLSILFESLRFFEKVSFFQFLFGLEWSPQTAIRPDQVAAEGLFGSVPLFFGTLMISLIAMLIAVPVGLVSAIYLAEYASTRMRATAKPLLEILAGIPTVVYGFFAALTVAPNLREFGERIGLSVSSESALAAGLVMGVMIIPFVSSLTDDVINAVPQSLRDASYGLGATKSETIKNVVLPAAFPGIMGSVLLAVSRAIGETMIVVMAAGLSANLTANPLDSMTTVTVQIVTLLTGDQEFESAKTLAAFALGLTLFVATLMLNIVALRIVRKYREQYD